MATTGGTKAGDPLGDAVFNMVQYKVLQECESQLQVAELVINIPRAYFDTSSPGPTTSFTHTSYVDDALFAFQGDPQNILARTSEAMHIIERVFAAHGIRLNMEVGKTEFAYIAFGEGARKVRHLVAASGGIFFTSCGRQ